MIDMTNNEAIGELKSIKVIRGLNAHQIEAINIGVRAIDNQKSGHWHARSREYLDTFGRFVTICQCSECGELSILGKYCSNCGANMEEK